MTESGYKRVRAGAIASGVFVAASTFMLLYLPAMFFIVASEGGPRNLERENLLLLVSLGVSVLVASRLGWRTKRYFDRRAGRS